MSDLLAKSLERIAPSATIAVTDAARRARAEGKDVIGLGAGEPDFDTPQHIKDAAVDALKQSKTKYTAVGGIPELREAICAKFQRENELTYTPEQILVSPGGKAIIYTAMMASLNPGDEVLIPAPYWTSYPDIVRLAGGTPVIVEAGHEQGFKIDADALRAKITKKSKWLIFNSPSNPTGAAYTRDEIAALMEVVLAHPNLHVLTDDMYEYLVYENFVFSTPAQVCPELYERTLTMNGCSKGFAMTGWRIGYAGGPRPLIQAMAKVQSQSTTHATSFCQWGALAALNGTRDFLDEWRAQFAKRRDVVVGALNEAAGLACTMPQGAFYAYPSCAGLLGKKSRGGAQLDSDVAVAKAMLEEVGVAVVPGAAFGLSPYLRLSYATGLPVLQEACGRVQDFCRTCA